MGSENIDVRRAEVDFEVEDTPAYLLRNVLRGDTSISIAYHYHRHDIHRRLRGVEPLPSTVPVGGWYEHGLGRTHAQMTVGAVRRRRVAVSERRKNGRPARRDQNGQMSRSRFKCTWADEPFTVQVPRFHHYT